jgi:hypothetical protein
MKTFITILGFSLLVATSTSAQDVTARADHRERSQRARIHHGRKSGDITNREATALNHEQRHIRRSERRAKADGTVTVTEKRRLDHRQNKASRHIHRAKSNPAESK